MGEEKYKFRMIGTCPKCGEQFIRQRGCTIAVCPCESVVEVPLRPAIFFRATVAIPVDVVEKKILEELRKYKNIGMIKTMIPRGIGLTSNTSFEGNNLPKPTKTHTIKKLCVIVKKTYLFVLSEVFEVSQTFNVGGENN